MARVVSFAQNAGPVVMVEGGPAKGVRFASVEGGAMLSEDVADHVATAFCSIPGYSVWVDPAIAEAEAKARIESEEKARADEQARERAAAEARAKADAADADDARDQAKQSKGKPPKET